MKKHMWIFFITAMIFAIVFSKDITDGIRASLDLCIYTLIPSLFPFLVLSKMTMLSESAEYIGKIIHPVTKRLFSLSDRGSYLFLAGIICGYPVGAKCISDMIKEKGISLEEGKRLLLFCNNAGPLFVIGAIGYGMYSNGQYGILLYISHLLAAIVIGIFTRKSAPSFKIPIKKNINPYFTRSVEDSIITVLNISGYVIFFSAICTIIKSIVPDKLKILRLFLCSVTEVTCAIKNVSNIYSLTPPIKLIITSFLLGFGGICVIFQTKGVIYGSGLDIAPFVYSKICQGALSAVFTYMFISVYPIRSCSHMVKEHKNFSSVLLFVSVALIIVYFFKINRRWNKKEHL